MSVSNSPVQFSYVADGISVNFAFPSYFIAVGDLLVEYVDAAGNVTDKVLNSDYTVSGVVDSKLNTYSLGGTVAFITPPPVGVGGNAIVRITRQTGITQPTVWNPGDPFPAGTNEVALDRITLVLQELAAGITRG